MIMLSSACYSFDFYVSYLRSIVAEHLILLLNDPGSQTAHYSLLIVLSVLYTIDLNGSLLIIANCF